MFVQSLLAGFLLTQGCFIQYQMEFVEVQIKLFWFRLLTAKWDKSTATVKQSKSRDKEGNPQMDRYYKRVVVTLSHRTKTQGRKVPLRNVPPHSSLPETPPESDA